MKKLKNYGLKLNKRKDKKAYVLGGLASLPKIVLQPDGQWDAYLPTREIQNDGFERYNCTAYNTNACLETLFNKLGVSIEDRSDRYVGIRAGTKPPGNDPHTVAQAIRDYGTIRESTLPNGGVDNVKDYYTYKGSDALTCDLEGQDFLKAYEIGHEYVWNGRISKEERIKRIKEALTYSPLGISVTAWIEENGVYVDKGQENNHWTCAFGYTDKGIKIFDSYDNTFKLLSWDHNIKVCKRYLITKQATAEEISIVQKILNLLLTWTGLIKEKPTVEPIIAPSPVLPIVEPVGSHLLEWATAIRDYEGSPGDLSYRNNNPGNLRGISGAFLKFKTWEEGWNALLDYLTRAATGKHKAYKPEFTLLRFFQTYAPSADKNDPVAYAKYVAKRIGVPVETQIKNLI